MDNRRIVRRCKVTYGSVGESQFIIMSYKSFILSSFILVATSVTAQQIKVLHYTETSGYDHSTRIFSRAMFEDLGIIHGFTVDDDQTGDAFNSLENLEQYEVVVFSNTSGNGILNSSQRSNFETYINGGGAYIGIHAASDTYRHSTANGDNTGTWDWYAEMAGASVQQSPNHTSANYNGTMDHLTDSELLEDVPNPWNKVEEYYYWESGYYNDNNVDLLQVQSTGGQSYDAPRPMAWFKELIGGGRSFYTALGHAQSNFTSDDNFRQLIANALNWAMNGEVDDCAGVPNGTSETDLCGECQEDGEANPLWNACVDCNGVPNGDAFVDNCGDCVGGNTGETACVQDCNGVFGGTAYEDDCGVCDDNPSNDNDTCADCAGVPYGTAYLDDCGICIGDNDVPCPPASLTGSVEWDTYCFERDATVLFYEAGTTTLVASYATTIYADGLFSIAEVESGTFDIFVKVDQHLQKGFGNAETVSGPNVLVVGPIIIGDLNDDNGINIDDMTALLDAFGTTTGDVNFNPLADLNCDGDVNIDDLTYLLTYYGQSGDEAPL